MEEAPRRPHRMRYLRNQHQYTVVPNRKKSKLQSETSRILVLQRLDKRLEVINAFIKTNLREELYLATGVDKDDDKPMWKVIQANLTFQEHLVKLEEDRLLWKQWNRGNQTEGRVCSKNSVPHVCICDQSIVVHKQKPKGKGKGKNSRSLQATPKKEPEQEYDNGVCGCCCRNRTTPATPVPFQPSLPISILEANIEEGIFSVGTSTSDSRDDTTTTKYSAIASLGQNEANHLIRVDTDTSRKSSATSETLIHENKNINPNNHTNINVTDAQDSHRAETYLDNQSPINSNIVSVNSSNNAIPLPMTSTDATTNTEISYPIRIPREATPPLELKKNTMTVRSGMYEPHPRIRQMKITYNKANMETRKLIAKRKIELQLRMQECKEFIANQESSFLTLPESKMMAEATNQEYIPENEDELIVENISDEGESLFNETDNELTTRKTIAKPFTCTIM